MCYPCCRSKVLPTSSVAQSEASRVRGALSFNSGTESPSPRPSPTQVGPARPGHHSCRNRASPISVGRGGARAASAARRPGRAWRRARRPVGVERVDRAQVVHRTLDVADDLRRRRHLALQAGHRGREPRGERVEADCRSGGMKKAHEAYIDVNGSKVLDRISDNSGLS